MEDQLEARISIIECIQEELGHDIREIKGQLARLIELIKGHTGIMSENIYGSSSFSLQSSSHPFMHHSCPVHEPYIPIASTISSKVNHSNWHHQTPTLSITPAFKEIPRPVGQTSSSRNNLRKSKINKDKTRWDPIPVTYTELFPRLLERQFITVSHAPPLKPPFPKWYNPNIHCDYHAGNPGHSTEDCNTLKYKVQTLIKAGKLNFESRDQPSNPSSNFSRIRIEKVPQNIPRTENNPRMEKLKERELATISGGVKRGRTEYVFEKIDEEKQVLELQEKNETLRRLVQNIEHKLKEQN